MRTKRDGSEREQPTVAHLTEDDGRDAALGRIKIVGCYCGTTAGFNRCAQALKRLGRRKTATRSGIQWKKRMLSLGGFFPLDILGWVGVGKGSLFFLASLASILAQTKFSLVFTHTMPAG